VPVSEGGRDDQLNDISGDFIVYTSYLNTTSDLGQIMLYEISSGMRQQISDLTTIFEARIHGEFVAWVEGTPGATRVMLQNLIGLPQGQSPIQLAGHTPAASDVEIGERLVTWRERSGGQDDVFAYDLLTGTRLTIANDLTINERAPSTSGPWVTWNSSRVGINEVRVEALNVDTGERRIIADNDALNISPTINGDFIAYESNIAGNFDIYLYQLSTGDTFQITTHPANQLLNNVYGQMVAYVDTRDGDSDVFVTLF
jgi:beta propeller repeat protein